MMTAKDAHGSRLFTSGDFLTTNQVAGFTHNLKKQKTEEAEKDIRAATVEAGFQEMMTAVVNDLLCPKILLCMTHTIFVNWLPKGGSPHLLCPL